MKRVLLIGLLFVAAAGVAQKPVAVAMKPESWTFRPGSVSFDDSAGVKRIKVEGPGYAVLKDVDFGDGTIEFDDIPTDRAFALFCFRWQDSLETECFYFRTEAGPYAPFGVQYTPIVKGVMYWDALPHFQTFANFSKSRYNHVKMVISGKRMRVWVNNLERPTLDVPRLEGTASHGTLAFQGNAIIANLVLKPGQVEGLSPEQGIDETVFDPRYLRHWHIAAPDTAHGDVRLARIGVQGMPGDQADWKTIDAERRGLVNLSRIYGGTKPFGVPRMMWLKTTIHADAVRTVQMRLGFLNDVMVFVNGRMTYSDKNYFGFPVMKVPVGRISLENATVSLPLTAGDNVVTIGLGSNFYTWGIIARLDDLDGISVER